MKTPAGCRVHAYMHVRARVHDTCRGAKDADTSRPEPAMVTADAHGCVRLHRNARLARSRARVAAGLAAGGCGHQATAEPLKGARISPFRLRPLKGAGGPAGPAGPGSRRSLPTHSCVPVRAHPCSPMRVRAWARTAVSVLTHAHPWCAPLRWCTAVLHHHQVVLMLWSSCCVLGAEHTHAELGRSTAPGGAGRLSPSPARGLGGLLCLRRPLTCTEAPWTDPRVLKTPPAPELWSPPRSRWQTPQTRSRLRAAQLGLSRPRAALIRPLWERPAPRMRKGPRRGPELL